MPHSLEELLDLDGLMHVVDIGAAANGEIPPYQNLLDKGVARLSAVDGDRRQLDALIASHGPTTAVFEKVIADGRRHSMHLSLHPESGMSSLLAPLPSHLAFFNGLAESSVVGSTVEVQTERLADIAELQAIDFLKMDIQGAELMVLENAGHALDQCVAIQIEASFIPLYAGQPSFGEIDLWMRGNGFLPHCFTTVKRWSIFPTMKDGNHLRPFNQLIECDIVYVRNLVDLGGLSDRQIRNIALISAYCYNSPDLCIHAVLALERRGALPERTFESVAALFNSP